MSGLTLPHVSLYLNESLFEAGQAYVALSNAHCLEDVQILALDPAAFKATQELPRNTHASLPPTTSTLVDLGHCLMSCATS